MSSGAGQAPGWRVEPLTARRWPDLEQVFAGRGCSQARGCWCMYYRESGRLQLPVGLSAAEHRRQRLRALALGRRSPGLIAYAGDGTPVGWLTLGPRSEFIKLRRSPVLKPVDERPVWSLVCFVVPARWRGMGVANALLDAAITHLRQLGVPAVEAYPVDRGTRSRDDTLWFGTLAMYLRRGFVEVARRRPERPIVRLELG